MAFQLPAWLSFMRTPAAAPEFTVPEGVRLYAVGDIHGKHDLLQQLMQRIKADAAGCPQKRIITVFLGDYIDRGHNSSGVIDVLCAEPPTGHEYIFLKGNHEETLLHFLQDPLVWRDWMRFGAMATLASYGIELPQQVDEHTPEYLQQCFEKQLPEAHLAFFQNLRLTYSIGDYFFVHAGINPHIPLDQQQAEDCLWIRDAFLKHGAYFEKYIIHGHTPQPQPDIRPNRANLDVSDSDKPALCALKLVGSTREIMMAETISTPIEH